MPLRKWCWQQSLEQVGDDLERLGDYSLADVADFVEAQFSDYVYQAYTKDEIFQ